MDEKDREKGLIFDVSVLLYIDNSDGSILVSVWFEGDTMPHKDDIKGMGGYSWSGRQAAEDFYSYRETKCWNKTIKLEQLADEVKKAKEIGASVREPDGGIFETAHYLLAVEKQKKFVEREEKIASIEKPSVPDVLAGHRWNQKIYGTGEKCSVYLDGERVDISDEEAREIELYLKAKEEYARKIKEIEEGEG